MKFDTRHLRHLLAVAELGSFSRAAVRLHLTQPALSRSIQALESRVGAPVLQRARGGIEPTEIGRLLLRHAQLLDASARDLERDIAMTKGLEQGQLRIGVGPYAGAALLGPVIGALNRMHPGLQLQIFVLPWHELHTRALARSVDLIVGVFSEINSPDFEARKLSTHPGVVVCRADHPLTTRQQPTAADLFAYPRTGPILPLPLVDRLLAALPEPIRGQVNRDNLVTIECDYSNVLKDVLRTSDALSVMPRYMVQPELDSGVLTMLPSIELGITIDIGIAWLQKRGLSLASQKFVDLLTECDRRLLDSYP